ncbi:MAG TPA: phosphate ABC transporter substrate-binding protein PstS [Acidimicrobiales bacterium]|nr:phosphate ABC transporter substrate-binding protein PstS [Acidimicrobiales bacterium]
MAPYPSTSPLRQRRRPTRRTIGLAGAGLAAAVVLAACGSSSPSSSGPGSSVGGAGNTPTTAAAKPSSLSAELSSLEAKPSGKVALTEDGSSLLYPLYQTWAAGYAKASPGFSSTSGADGSGTGIADAESGTTVLGASDAYLPPGTSTQYPTLENIPMAISAQMINYNLPGLAGTHLKLDGKVLAGMYQGTITNWDAPAIKALNPGVTLPNLKVVPLHRSDSSGDSFLFTSYLADSDPASFAGKQGPSTSPSFPSVPGALAEKGNSGMVAGCAATKGCVAYIGISYKADTTKANLGEAMLQNKSGSYELPSPATIHAEASGYTSIPTNGAISLIYGSAKNGYPIINFEYIVVKTDQSSSTTAAGVKAFLAWCIDPNHGNQASYLDTVGFQPLPAGGLAVSLDLIKKIS